MMRRPSSAVFVVLGGLGNMFGSIVAAAALTILPEALRPIAEYRMLLYAVLLIAMMLTANHPFVRGLFDRFRKTGQIQLEADEDEEGEAA